jgi:hypothetical protein
VTAEILSKMGPIHHLHNPNQTNNTCNNKVDENPVWDKLETKTVGFDFGIMTKTKKLCLS